MATYQYPTNAELKEIEQVKLPLLIQDDPIFDLFPIRNENTDIVMWEQMDNYTGLQAVRGVDGAPGRVKLVGANRYIAQPGVYGEFLTISEKELTALRPLGTFGNVLSLDEMIMKRQDQLLNRRIDRIKLLIWTLLTTGTFSVSNDSGVSHTDTYSVQTSSGSAWGTAASGTPLIDFRAIKLLARGKGCSFGRKAKAFMNTATLNKLLAITNAADIGGKRVTAGNTLNTLKEINQILLDNDLPEIVEYDEGYINDAGTWVNFIPVNKTVVVGARQTGVKVGGYVMTRNANNEGFAPGSYTKVIEKGENTVPNHFEIHDGHNGTPIIEFPGSVVILTTT